MPPAAGNVFRPLSACQGLSDVLSGANGGNVFRAMSTAGGGQPTFTSGIERLDGFRAAMAARGRAVADEYVGFGDDAWSVHSGMRATRDILALPSRPTALVAAGDTLAVGAIQAARDVGLRVPEDVAVVSFDDPFFAELLDPPITALRRNDRHLGELAANLLLHAIETRRFGPPTEVRLPMELIIRASCGCPL